MSAAELEQARLAQLDALESLRDWWNDWAVTLRSRYGTRHQLKLGLTTAKKRGPTGGEDEEGEEDELDEQDAVDAPPTDANRPRVGADSLVTA